MQPSQPTSVPLPAAIAQQPLIAADRVASQSEPRRRWCRARFGLALALMLAAYGCVGDAMDLERSDSELTLSDVRPFRIDPALGGSDGIALSDEVIATSDDSRIVTARSEGIRLRVQRANADGQRDSTFGSFGTRLVSAPTGYRFGPVADMMTDHLGRIFVLVGASASSQRSLVIRLKKDGAIDTSFSDDGIAFVHYDLQLPRALARGAYTTFVVGKRLDRALVVSRLTNAGAVDTSFGSAGRVIHSASFLQSDADIVSEPSISGVVVLTSRRPDYLARTSILRLDYYGRPDATFGGGDGIVDGPLLGEAPTTYQAAHIARSYDGRYLVSGFFRSSDGSSENRIEAYLPDGSLDTSFGEEGVQHVEDLTRPADMLLEPATGNILLLGRLDDPTLSKLMLVDHDVATGERVSAPLLTPCPPFTDPGDGTVDAGRMTIDIEGRALLLGAGRLVRAFREPWQVSPGQLQAPNSSN